MASRFLRADLRRAFRPSRPQSGIRTNALFFAARTTDHLPSSSSVSTTSRTNSGAVAAEAAAALPSSGWHSTSGQPLGRACSTLATTCSGGVDALGHVGVSNTSSSRFDCSSVTSAAGLPYGCCRGRGATAGGALLSSRQQQAGRRFLSSRRGSAGDQTLTNENITAAKVLLVWETKDGSKETTLVSRQQALAAAKAANLDLVQVSGKNDQVVCRLMDFKKEEYRKQKKQKASAKRPQKKKEMRLRGMIANHDFERKVNDVKRYLERGDIVKVVLEANTSLLKRSGNCLNDLQENFEAAMEEFEGVVMKASGGRNGYTRREIECHPKAIKATTAKASKSAAAAAAAENTSPAGVVEPGEKEKPKPPLPRGVLDEETVRGILSGSVAAAKRGESQEGLASSDNSITASFSEDGSEEEKSEESYSVEECTEDASDEEELEAGAGEGKEEATPLTSGSVGIWDADLFDDLAEGADNDDEWEKYQARKREDRRKQEEANERAGVADSYAKRGGGGGRKNRRARDDDSGNNGGGGGRRARSEESDGGDERRRRARDSVGRGGGRGGGTTGRRGTDGGDRNRGAGAGTGRHEGGFAGRGGMPQSMRGGSGRGRGGGGSGSGNRWQGDEGREGGRGRGSGGRGWAPPPAAPVRPPQKYKWRTSIADGSGASAGAGAPAQQQQQKLRRESGNAQGAVASPPQGGGSRGTPADDAGGEIRGFRARFGGGATGSGQQQTPPVGR